MDRQIQLHTGDGNIIAISRNDLERLDDEPKRDLAKSILKHIQRNAIIIPVAKLETMMKDMGLYEYIRWDDLYNTRGES